MKKVLIVNNLLGYYGAENVLNNLVNHLDQSKYDITVLTLLESDNARLASGIQYGFIFSRQNNVITKVINKVKILLGYKRLAKVYCNGYDIAVAFKMGECAKIVSFCDAPQKICWIHSNVTELEEACSYSFTSIEDEIKTLHKFDRMIAVSNACAESFYRKYTEEIPVKVIYNPIDAESILAKAQEGIPECHNYIFEDSVPILGTVARIDNQKRIDRLINISKRLTCEGIKHRMLIIGDGVDFQKYCGMILDEQLDNIIMLGFQKNPYKYVKQLSLFICSSVWESYSMVVNEALALGIPVISTKCGGPEEVLQYGKYGVLTENNEASLYEAVKLFLCNGMQNVERYDPTSSMTSFMRSIDDLFLGE